MMKKISLILFAALLFAGVALAAEESAGTAAMAGGATMTGTIDNVDLMAKSITLKVQAKGKTEAESKTFTFNDQTSFVGAGKSSASIKPEDLKIGDRVKVEADSTNLALKVSVQGAPSAKPQTDKQ